MVSAHLQEEQSYQRQWQGEAEADHDCRSTQHRASLAEHSPGSANANSIPQFPLGVSYASTFFPTFPGARKELGTGLKLGKGLSWSHPHAPSMASSVKVDHTPSGSEADPGCGDAGEARTQALPSCSDGCTAPKGSPFMLQHWNCLHQGLR